MRRSTAAGPGRHVTGARAVALLLVLVPAALTAALLLLGLVHAGTLLEGASGAGLPAAAAGLCGAFVLTQLGRVEVEVRERTRSLSLVGLPQVLGLVFLPPGWLLGAHLVAALAVARLQRTPVRAAAPPASVHLLGTALAATVLHSVLEPAPGLTVRTAVLTCAAVAVVDVLSTSLLLLAVRAEVGPLRRGDLVGAYGPAAATTTLATTLGLLSVVLIEDGPVGWVLLGLVAAGSTAAYRAFMLLRRRHGDLRMVQGFIDRSVTTDAGDVLAPDLVAGIRELVRAQTARLVWRSREGEVQVHASSHDPTLLLPPLVMPPAGADGLVTLATADPATRRWLDGLHAREAVVLDLVRFGGTGLLVVTDRLGAGRFGADDERLVGALAGHLVVRMRNTELVDRVRWEANHDAMTGLPNRRVLLSALELYIGPGAAPVPARAGRPAPETAVLVMVVDRLGEVNDALGHAVGDQVLAEVARRLGRLGLPGSTIARLSGEHFAVAVPAVRPGGALALANRLRSTTDEPVALLDAVISAGARVGIATTTGGEGVDAAEL
ncbi:diguanylate cyclase domain-containing protein, partial [Aquipuribacter hungaricus]